MKKERSEERMKKDEDKDSVQIDGCGLHRGSSCKGGQGGAASDGASDDQLVSLGHTKIASSEWC